jgi:pSer/pThr/pTyr-binding forkhead associated (FHA) protein/ribosomal protein L40E
MSICPNCNHSNPSGATQCEACFTPLPATANCPSCGASVQLDATFCGQCGTSLKSAAVPYPDQTIPNVESALPPTIIAVPGGSVSQAPAAVAPDPFVAEPIPEPSFAASTPTPVPVAEPIAEPIAVVASEPFAPPTAVPEPEVTPSPAVAATPGASSTQLQQQGFQLTHIQSGTVIDIPSNVNVLHMGKPNDQIPPDIDVSGFPCAEVVSRIHADLRIEGDSVYVEDTGSSNGTYVNHNVLPKGNRHLLRVGDRISLGKGDLVTFLFHVAG